MKLKFPDSYPFGLGPYDLNPGDRIVTTETPTSWSATVLTPDLEAIEVESRLDLLLGIAAEHGVVIRHWIVTEEGNVCVP